jgi:hypothetical protein
MHDMRAASKAGLRLVYRLCYDDPKRNSADNGKCAIEKPGGR